MAETSSIAIVDDDPPVLKALRRFLRGRGFDVRTYESGRAFLETLPQREPDCLIVDLQMPEMTGLELHQQLAGRGYHIPTIVITAHAQEDERKLCLSAGVTAFFSKPVPIPSLLEAIEVARRTPK
jgi:FixJ family two-component response regulator